MASVNILNNLQDKSDANLILITREGNAKAFRLLMERHIQYATLIASKFLLREEDIKDVVQEAFIRVWKNLIDFNEQCLFTTWLHRIVFNLCIDRMRVIKRRSEFALPVTLESKENCANDFSDPADSVDSMAISNVIREYALRLSRIQKLIFVLRDLQDLSVEEVCHITGFNENKVKSNLYHARKFMREKLHKGGYL